MCFLFKFSPFTHFVSLTVKSFMTISQNATKSIYRSSGRTYTQFYIQDLKLMLLHSLRDAEVDEKQHTSKTGPISYLRQRHLLPVIYMGSMYMFV